ncbi:peptidoglycan DD-metalloendopeptidase family protein [Azoarcus sp. L1K30]|nr:peptidoglycan DD-metalloendopeptidase family protein [Azoarcus sp. L1K30]MBR0566340.1 peptidoglycan DD-metalloendopeptidase family protein [Azoarcus sp. L1K30]
MRGALVLGLAISSLPGAVGAEAPVEISEKRSDLDELKQRIRALQKDMAQTEATRSDAANALAEAERAVSAAERGVRRLAAERSDTEKKLAMLEAEQREVGARIDARQGELAEWLRRHYMYGAADGVAPFLSARDLNQLARDAHYMEHLGRARLTLIDDLRADLRNKATRAIEIAARRDRLTRLEVEQREQQTALLAVHARRREALAQIAAQLKSQRQEVSELKADEQRLTRLIETLAQRAREVAARQAAARAAEARRAQAEAQTAESRSNGRSGRSGGISPRHSEPVVGEVRHAAGATPTGVSFGQLRGQLRFPVRGELIGRFGAQRAEGGTTWKGVFIRAASGAEVRAVAAGEVVFSDWLRGYGNLLILDHGGDYLSVYGNNDALLKVVGDNVNGGDAIASVGASGGGPESGLYFEVRHQGRALDPLQWVRLN